MLSLENCCEWVWFWAGSWWSCGQNYYVILFGVIACLPLVSRLWVWCWRSWSRRGLSSGPVMEDGLGQQVAPVGSLPVQGAVIFGRRITLCHGMDLLILVCMRAHICVCVCEECYRWYSKARSQSHFLNLVYSITLFMSSFLSLSLSLTQPPPTLFPRSPSSSALCCTHWFPSSAWSPWFSSLSGCGGITSWPTRQLSSPRTWVQLWSLFLAAPGGGNQE